SHALPQVIGAAKIGRDPAVTIEAGVEAAVRVKAGHEEIISAAAKGISGDHDLPVGLHSHAGDRLQCWKIIANLTAVAKGAVQAAVGVVPGHRQLFAAEKRPRRSSNNE